MENARMKLLLRSYLLLIFIALTRTNNTCATNDTNCPWITIFVHGNFGAHWVAFDLDTIIKDDCKGSLYEKLQSRARLNAIKQENLVNTRFYPALGLRNITLDEKTTDATSFALAKTYHAISTMMNEQQASNTSYYSFGWNGQLSQKARRHAAISLYQALSQEVAAYNARGLSPRVRLICHSHGGNVALNLAGINAALSGEQFSDPETTANIEEIKQSLEKLELSQNLPSQFYIDELVMLATPIQKETEGLAASRFFKQVFTGYSHNDKTQIIDVLSTGGTGSTRTISKNKLGTNTREICYSVVDHTKQQKQKFINFIGNTLQQYLPNAVKVFTKITHIHEKKNFDQHALEKAFKQTISNKQIHPDDPSHGDFFNCSCKKNLSAAEKLPLLVWTPLINQCFNEHKNNDLHVTLHYYEKTIAIVVHHETEEKVVEIPQEKCIELKKNFFDYIMTP